MEADDSDRPAATTSSGLKGLSTYLVEPELEHQVKLAQKQKTTLVELSNVADASLAARADTAEGGFAEATRTKSKIANRSHPPPLTDPEPTDQPRVSVPEGVLDGRRQKCEKAMV